jgi:hypothetical protein
MALGACTLGLTWALFLAKRAAVFMDLIGPVNTKLIMKLNLFVVVVVLTVILSGCVVVPAHPYAYHPSERVYVY